MLVLKDARVVTVAGRTLERGTVLVEDGKIAVIEIGRASCRERV